MSPKSKPSSADERPVRARRNPPSTERQLQDKIEQLKALQRVSVAIASTMKPLMIGQVIVREVMQLTQASYVIVYLCDYATNTLVPEFHDSAPASPRTLDLIGSEDLAVEVAHSGRLRQTHGFVESGRGGSRRTTGQCRLCIPLVVGDEIVGVVDIHAVRESPFDKDLEEMLETLAAQAAQVIRNAATHEELEQHYRELSLLYEIQQEIASTLNYQQILDHIVHRAHKLLEVREVTIRLVSDTMAGRMIRIVATTGQTFIGPSEVPLVQSYVDQQVIGGELVYIADVQSDERFRYRDAAQQAGVVSLLCAPLIARRETIGTIRLYTDSRRDFSPAERKMLLALAGQAATAIQNARLYSQIEAKNQELYHSNQALQAAQKELVKKERLAALGEMAATVAHEIRNPLTSIRGFAQRILKRYSTTADERLGEYTSIIMEEVDRLNKFIKDVLDFARHVKPNFEPHDINRITGDVLSFLSTDLSRKEISLLAVFDDQVPMTYMDEGQIRQMLLNVIQNAVAAMPVGGTLAVQTRRMDRFVRLRVSDNGSGIPQEVMQKIWSPFFTTKTHGTGLGLSLVQRIIDDHRGRITIRSRPGVGTVVSMWLPVVKSAHGLMTFNTAGQKVLSAKPH